MSISLGNRNGCLLIWGNGNGCLLVRGMGVYWYGEMGMGVYWYGEMGIGMGKWEWVSISMGNRNGCLLVQGMGEQETETGHKPHPSEKAGRRVRGKLREREREEEEEEEEWTVKREMKKWKQRLREKYSHLPQHYRGYEALMEDDSHIDTSYPTPTSMYIEAVACYFIFSKPLSCW